MHEMFSLLFIAEPGYYEDKKFGIRIENLVLVKRAPTKVYNFYIWLLFIKLKGFYENLYWLMLIPGYYKVS